MLRWIFAGLCLVGSNVPALAHAGDFLSLPLPELVGPIGHEIGQREAHFDFGREFDRVERVILLLDARTTPTQYEYCGYFDAPEPCSFHEVPAEFLGYLPTPAFLDSSLTTIGGFGESRAEQAGVFRPWAGTTLSFEYLRDGRGTLVLSFNGLIFIPEDIIRNFVGPTGEIFEALLIIEAISDEEPKLDARCDRLGRASLKRTVRDLPKRCR